MSCGTLSLDRFNGREQYAVSKATIEVYEENNGYRVDFDVETEETPLKTLPDTEELPARPEANFFVKMPSFSWDTLVGSRYEMPCGYDEETEEYLTHFYYCEHEETDDNVIQVMEADGGRYHVTITATCTDVNYYDGSKPRTKITIDAWFTPMKT